MITATQFALKSNTKTALAALTYMTTLWLAEMWELEAIQRDKSGTVVQRIAVPKNRAVVRNDLLTAEAILGIVGAIYTPIQNAEAFAFFDILTQQYNGIYEKGFIIDNGRQIILVAKLGEDYEVRPGDVISDYITLVNSFDGSSPYKAFFTPIRMSSGAFCRASFGGAVNNIAIRHTKTAQSRMKDAMAVLNVSAKFFEKFRELSAQMVQKSISKKIIDTYLEKVFGEPKTQPGKDKLASIANLIIMGKGNTGKTIWDAYCGVIEWVDFHKYHGKKDANVLNAGSAISTGVGIKERAFKVALSML